MVIHDALTEFREYSKLKSRTRTYLLAALLAVLGVVAEFLVNSAAQQSLRALSVFADLMRSVPLGLIVVAVVWRGTELIAFRRIGDDAIAGILQQPSAIVSLCLLSAFCCDWALLAARIGVIGPSGVADWLGAIGGVLPLADAWGFFNGAITMAQDAHMSVLGARRPVHAIVLSGLFVLTDFHRSAVLTLQATLVGASICYFCLNLARFAGFAAALATWAMLYLLAIDEIPTFMSEPTGMWIGVFGLGLLLDGFFRGAPAPLALGLGSLLLGFMARPGPLLILPAIFLAALCLLRTSGRDAKLFTLYSVGCVAFSLIVPSISYLVYRHPNDSALGGSFSQILYQFSVGSTDWRQIFIDYPGNNSAAFIYEKAFENIWNHPMTILRAYFQIDFVALRDVPSVLLEDFARPFGLTSQSCSTVRVCNFLYPAIFEPVIPDVLFYGGLTGLVVWPNWSRGWRVLIIFIAAAYAASLPIIWLDFNVRPQAVTFPLLCFAMAGLLARATKPAPERPRQSAAEIVAVALGALIFIGIFVPRLHAAITRPHLAKPPAGSLGETQVYLNFGPFAPVLRLVDAAGRTIRPDIPVSEFRQSSRVQAQQEYYMQFQAGDQIALGFQTANWDSYGYVSRPFCIPDRNWTFLATLGREFPPGFYHIESLVPVDANGRPLAESAPLPYRCLDGDQVSRF